MKYTARLVLLALASFFLFNACGNFDDVTIGEPTDVKVKGFEDNFLKVNVTVPVNNPTIHKIKIEKMDVKVFINDRYIGKLVIDDNLVLRGKENTLKQIPVKVRLSNILVLAFIRMSLKKGQQTEARFEGEIEARALLIKKTIKINETRKFAI